MSKKEWWMVFRLHGKEICAYTTRGTFYGEFNNTMDMLAREHGCEKSEIDATLEEREAEERRIKWK